jgi:hypothetical protein
MLDTVASLATQTGSRLDVTEERTPATQQEFTFTATLTSVQDAAVTNLARHDLGVLIAPPGAGKTVMACAVIAARQARSAAIPAGLRGHPRGSGGVGPDRLRAGPSGSRTRRRGGIRR